MALTQTGTMMGESAAYGGFVDAAGGIVTIVLAIVGLSHTAPEMMVSVATIVFGAALLIQGGAMLSEYAQIVPTLSREASAQFGGGGLSAVFLAGAAGIVLGILALLGVQTAVLTSAAIIAFGAALMLSSNAVWHLHSAKRASLATPVTPASPPASTTEILANEMAYGSATMQALAGLAAIVLGVIALAGGNATVLPLVALLALGGTLILTGSTLSATVMGFMRPASGEHLAHTQP